MPELPEVETVRRGLKGFVLGAKILRIEVFCGKSFVGEPVQGKIIDIRRYGKALIINLSNGLSLMVHLRMTGQLIYDGKERWAAGHPSENFVDNLPNKQTRVVIELDKGRLFFNDQRKFGFIKVLKTEEVEGEAFVKKLGKEPWVMTGQELFEKLQRHKKASIKTVILNQTVVAGLGNIYADEALFIAGVHPVTKAGELGLRDAERILTAAKTVMDKSIELGGSTMRNYVKADGTRGNYLDAFAKVYQRTGEPCAKCGAKIKKIKLGGRGTHFCPNCQKTKVTPVRAVEKPVENSKKGKRND